jgi:fatty acid desaturase
MAAKLVTKSNFRILIKSILRYVRQLTKNPVIAVLTVILLIAAYIGLLYFALVYGLRHSSTSIF